jgi:Flp pilus assembly protein TadD
LARLARDPRDVNALIDAGNAALAMGDVDAATGFFARADQLSPENARVKAGLAGALVRSENPFDAIPLFAEAERAGGMTPKLAADRALAYDLVGDNVTAQRYYREALAAGPNNEATRRLALSQAIGGDKVGMETTLAPLLQRQDKAAWRTRAFALAVLNRPEEAVEIAYSTMPKDMAAAVAPYLRYMPRLTKAQQAAAANFGHFPRAADIGRDDPRMARYASAKRVVGADAALVPNGKPLGRDNRKSGSQPSAQSAAHTAAHTASAVVTRSAPPELTPTREVAAAPSLAVAASVPKSPQLATTAAPVATKAVGPTVAPAIPATQRAARPAVIVAPATSAPAPAIVLPPKPMPATTVARPAHRNLADAFADLSLPKSDASPASGAVDIRRITPTHVTATAKPATTKSAPAKAVVPPKPINPSRIWVQVGTGRDEAALAFTWRGLVRENPELFREKSGSISDWGRTNRLLTGPFDTDAAADAFLKRAKRAKLDAFVWTSPAGQAVDALPSK